MNDSVYPQSTKALRPQCDVRYRKEPILEPQQLLHNLLPRRNPETAALM
ncbi:MAG TPA: hypothetical protein VFK45_04830 [Gammaproteobacteria bacterium]|nr:hypothetical protein [Gammaproteobacteria bacterium]